MTNNHFKWDILCSTVQILDSFICKSLRGHWWSVSAQHLLDKERRWKSRSPWQTKLTLILKRRASTINFYQKITESLGREGSPPLHHSVQFCFGRAVLNPPQLVINSFHGGIHHRIYDFDWHTITSFRQKCSLTSGKNVYGEEDGFKNFKSVACLQVHTQ